MQKLKAIDYILKEMAINSEEWRRRVSAVSGEKEYF